MLLITLQILRSYNFQAYILQHNQCRRLSILFIANLALADIVLPLVTSLSTPVVVTMHGGPGAGDHVTRSLTCRAVQGLMTTIMAVAVVSLGDLSHH